MKAEYKTDIKLNPCPFCGGEAKVFIETKCGGYTTEGLIYIQCSECGARSGGYRNDGIQLLMPDIKDVAASWNRRYSGINDMNGKPICHGDYIRISGIQWADEIPGMYRVKYSVNEFTWYLVRVYEYEHLGIGLYSFADLNLSMFTDEIELVDIKTVNDCIKEKGVDIHGEER